MIYLCYRTTHVEPHLMSRIHPHQPEENPIFCRIKRRSLLAIASVAEKAVDPVQPKGPLLDGLSMTHDHALGRGATSGSHMVAVL
jgi:hypothetical protein